MKRFKGQLRPKWWWAQRQRLRAFAKSQPAIAEIISIVLEDYRELRRD